MFMLSFVKGMGERSGGGKGGCGGRECQQGRDGGEWEGQEIARGGRRAGQESTVERGRREVGRVVGAAYRGGVAGREGTSGACRVGSFGQWGDGEKAPMASQSHQDPYSMQRWFHRQPQPHVQCLGRCSDLWCFNDTLRLFTRCSLLSLCWVASCPLAARFPFRPRPPPPAAPDWSGRNTAWQVLEGFPPSTLFPSAQAPPPGWREAGLAVWGQESRGEGAAHGCGQGLCSSKDVAAWGVVAGNLLAVPFTDSLEHPRHARGWESGQGGCWVGVANPDPAHYLITITGSFA